MERCHCGKCCNEKGHSQGPFPLTVAGPILAPTSETGGRRAWPAAWLGLPAGPQEEPRAGPAERQPGFSTLESARPSRGVPTWPRETRALGPPFLLYFLARPLLPGCLLSLKNLTLATGFYRQNSVSFLIQSSALNLNQEDVASPSTRGRRCDAHAGVPREGTRFARRGRACGRGFSPSLPEVSRAWTLPQAAFPSKVAAFRTIFCGG